MSKQVNHFIFFLILTVTGLTVNGQESMLYIGGGIAPLHRTVQSDFGNEQLPIRGFIEYKINRLAIQASYADRASYIKDNFTFKHSGPNISLLYYLKKSFQQGTLVPYIKIGANYKTTQFTTEGYPGISSYELKVEKDNSIGIDIGSGVKYPIGKYIVGLEINYSKNSSSKFIAGGFSPQSLISDHFFAEINISIPIKIAGKRKLATTCPNL